MREKLIEVAIKVEDQALLLGDLKTAINLNWLRNAVQQGIDSEEAFVRFLEMTLVGK